MDSWKWNPKVGAISSGGSRTWPLEGAPAPALTRRMKGANFLSSMPALRITHLFSVGLSDFLNMACPLDFVNCQRGCVLSFCVLAVFMFCDLLCRFLYSFFFALFFPVSKAFFAVRDAEDCFTRLGENIIVIGIPASQVYKRSVVSLLLGTGERLWFSVLFLFN